MTPSRLLCLVFALSLRAGAQQLPPAGYTPLLALSDEFEGEVLDAAKWTAATAGWKGRQPGLFDPSNAIVGGGALQLWARAAHRNASWPAGYDNYTTAYVQSVATAREGYFEIRWRSGNSGISSSWWFHAGNSTEWTEIDVFESTGVDNPSHSGALARDFASTTHIFKLPGSNASTLPARCNCTEDDGGGSCSRRAVWQLPAGQSFADAFHVAGLLWDDGGIRVFLDGALVNTVPSPCLIEEIGMNFDRETMPGWMELPDPATLPDHPFLIDYVRSYAPPAAAAPAPLAPAAVAPPAAKPWNPRPPCAAPLGVDTPAVAESMCSLELARAGDVVVREIGLPASATLVTVPVLGPVFYDDLTAGVEMILQYFGGANSESKDILSARTTPITARNLGNRNFSWLVSMMVSTAEYPDNSTIPQPSLPVRLENVGARSIAALQFNTTSPPVEADFKAACGSLLSSRLPKGYAFDDASSWTPAYVFFSGQFASFFTSECWAEVTKSAALEV